jgi:arginyl-tRNA synthetase
MMRERIEQVIRAAVGPEAKFVVERPRDMAHGDYSTNAALVNKLDPRELADNLHIEGVETIEVAGKFLNFRLSRTALVPQPVPALQTHAGKEVLVEYTSPNLFKPLHVGNLIGNILGESVVRLLERSGATVRRLNYPSDIGLSVAKGVWGLEHTGGNPDDIHALGEAYRLGNAAYEDGSAKEKIEEINRALYEGSNAQWSELRERGVATSLRHLHELCAMLGTAFDKEFFESQSGPVGKKIVEENIGEKIGEKTFRKSDGAVVFDGESYDPTLHTRVFLNSQGLPTYEAKEVGLFKLKQDGYPDFAASITVTGKEQSEFFKVVFAALKKLFPDSATKDLRHISTSFLRLTTGKMSSRLGSVVTGESLIETLKEAAREKMQGRELANADQVAEQVAVGALKYAVLKQGSGRDIIFDPEKSLSLEGDSGPYLQYALTRARSLVRMAKDAGIEPGNDDMPPQATELERVLVHYAEVVERAARELEPHYLTTYLTEVASAFNSWYASTRLIGGEYPRYGLWLTYAVIKTLSEGLHTLGIPAPEEM